MRFDRGNLEIAIWKFLESFVLPGVNSSFSQGIVHSPRESEIPQEFVPRGIHSCPRVPRGCEIFWIWRTNRRFWRKWQFGGHFEWRFYFPPNRSKCWGGGGGGSGRRTKIPLGKKSVSDFSLETSLNSFEKESLLKLKTVIWGSCWERGAVLCFACPSLERHSQKEFLGASESRDQALGV